MQAGLESVSQGSIIYFGAGETPAREPVSHPIEHKSLAGDPGLETGATHPARSPLCLSSRALVSGGSGMRLAAGGDFQSMLDQPND